MLWLPFSVPGLVFVLNPICAVSISFNTFQKKFPGGVPKNFAKFTRKHLCQSLFFNKVVGLGPTTLLKNTLALYKKRNSGTGIFLWILRNFQNNFLQRTPPVAASNFPVTWPELPPPPPQISKMESFGTLVNSFWPLTIAVANLPFYMFSGVLGTSRFHMFLRKCWKYWKELGMGLKCVRLLLHFDNFEFQFFNGVFSCKAQVVMSVRQT